MNYTKDKIVFVSCDFKGENGRNFLLMGSNNQPMRFLERDSDLILTFSRDFHSHKSIMYFFMCSVMIDDIADRLKTI